jgi:hypothetical protein
VWGIIRIKRSDNSSGKKSGSYQFNQKLGHLCGDWCIIVFREEEYSEKVGSN